MQQPKFVSLGASRFGNPLLCSSSMNIDNNCFSLCCWASSTTRGLRGLTMTYVMTAIVVMATIAGRSRALVQEPRDDEPLTCSEGRVRCLGDVTCKVLMETISKVCGESSKSPLSNKLPFSSKLPFYCW